jgi:heparan-alpha-glucosaminide N-acetyltransferase
MSSAAGNTPRLMSLDAYRGFVMVCLCGSGFGIAEVAERMPDSPFWQTLGPQFEHVAWRGGVFWDLIQPSFMFMVGAALSFSVAKREAAGQSMSALWGHVMFRSVALIVLGIFLSSGGGSGTNFTFMNVLTQIGLGYPLLFLMSQWSPRAQAGAAVVLLLGYWAWFATGRLPGEGFDWSAYRLPPDWTFLTGFGAHWQIHTNVAAAFDRWFLNLFPRPEPFVFNAGGYQTLNFVPSIVTMLFGLMAGDLIRQSKAVWPTVWRLTLFGIAGLGLGWGLDALGVCPLVKRIWTPSWTLYSTGWTVLMLTGFYAVIDGLGWRSWAFPLVVAGMNSMVLYLLSQLLRGYTLESLQRHLGQWWLTAFGEQYEPLVGSLAVLLCFWLFVFWLYRQKAFLRL